MAFANIPSEMKRHKKTAIRLSFFKEAKTCIESQERVGFCWESEKEGEEGQVRLALNEKVKKVRRRESWHNKC